MKYIANKPGSKRRPCGCPWCRLVAKECTIKRPRVRREDDAYAANVAEALGYSDTPLLRAIRAGEEDLERGELLSWEDVFRE